MIKDYSVLTAKDRFRFYSHYKNLMPYDKRFRLIRLALSPIEDMDVNITKDDKSVLVWSDDSFKESAVDFIGDRETDIFEEAYDKYYDKRWDEMPQVDISLEDWDILKEKWKQLKKEKPKVIVFELDDSGLLDKVDVYGKDELSPEDINYIEQEHEKYLKYEKARQKYIANHPDYSEVWRGPQDDEYEEDIMKYYDKD